MRPTRSKSSAGKSLAKGIRRSTAGSCERCGDGSLPASFPCARAFRCEWLELDAFLDSGFSLERVLEPLSVGSSRKFRAVEATL